MNYYVVDANVMLTAGKLQSEIDDEMLHCWHECIEFIHEVTEKKSIIVVDDNYEVLNEYKNINGIQGYPNYSVNFFRYVISNQKDHIDFIHLDKNTDDEYESFPDSTIIKDFDPADHKYIALAFNHKKKPPIVEATDSKWWGILDELKKYGISVHLIDKDYLEKKYYQKMSS